MKSTNFERAGELVNHYIKSLTTEMNVGRTWIEINLAKFGIVDDWRGFSFGESHAIWYACILKAGALHRVNRAECKRFPVNKQNGKTTLVTVKKLLTPRSNIFSSVTGQRLRELCSDAELTL